MNTAGVTVDDVAAFLQKHRDVPFQQSIKSEVEQILSNPDTNMENVHRLICLVQGAFSAELVVPPKGLDLGIESTFVYKCLFKDKPYTLEIRFSSAWNAAVYIAALEAVRQYHLVTETQYVYMTDGVNDMTKTCQDIMIRNMNEQKKRRRQRTLH